MADNVQIIGSDLEDDWSTIILWEEDTDYDLVTATTREIGELRGEEHGGTSIVFEGGTANASYYRWLRSMDGHEFDHTDKSKARIVTADDKPVLAIMNGQDYVKIGGSEGTSTGSIGGKGTHATDNQQVFTTKGAGTCTFIEYHQLVVYETACSGVGVNSGRVKGFYLDGPANEPTDLRCYNCIAFDVSSADDIAYGWHRGTCYNCVAVDIDAPGGAKKDAYGYHSCVCYNSYGGDVTSDPAGANYAFSLCTGDYNAGDDTTEPGVNSITVSVANCNFVSSSDPEDFHITLGSDLIGAGDDSYSNDFDVDGPVLIARDDIGIHEFRAVRGRVVGGGVGSGATVL